MALLPTPMVELLDYEDGESILLLRIDENNHVTDEILIDRETALAIAWEIIEMLEPKCLSQ